MDFLNLIVCDICSRYSSEEIEDKISECKNKYENWSAERLIEESFRRPNYYSTSDLVDLLYFVREYMVKLDIVPREIIDRRIATYFSEEKCEHAH